MLFPPVPCVNACPPAVALVRPRKVSCCIRPCSHSCPAETLCRFTFALDFSGRRPILDRATQDHCLLHERAYGHQNRSGRQPREARRWWEYFHPDGTTFLERTQSFPVMPASWLDQSRYFFNPRQASDPVAVPPLPSLLVAQLAERRGRPARPGCAEGATSIGHPDEASGIFLLARHH